MIISDDRAALTAALEDSANIFLFVFAGPDSKATQIYEMAKTAATEGWRRSVLIQDPSILTAQETSDWYAGPGTYTTISKTRQVVARGPLSDLCFASGNPEARKIRNSFNTADEA